MKRRALIRQCLFLVQKSPVSLPDSLKYAGIPADSIFNTKNFVTAKLQSTLKCEVLVQEKEQNPR